MMESNKNIKRMIQYHLDPEVYKVLHESLTDPDADRGIYETWSGRALSTYEALKQVYRLVNKDIL